MLLHCLLDRLTEEIISRSSAVLFEKSYFEANLLTFLKPYNPEILNVCISKSIIHWGRVAVIGVCVYGPGCMDPFQAKLGVFQVFACFGLMFFCGFGSGMDGVGGIRTSSANIVGIHV